MAPKGYRDRKTKAQGSRDIVVHQGGFLGGMNNDAPASELGSTQVAWAENCICRRDRIDARPGVGTSGTVGTGYTMDDAVVIYYSNNLQSTLYIEMTGHIYWLSEDGESTELTYMYNMEKIIGSPNQTTMKDFNGGVLVFNKAFIFFIDDDFFVRVLTYSDFTIDDNGMNMGSTNSSGDIYKYKYAIAYVREESNVKKMMSKLYVLPLNEYSYEDDVALGGGTYGIYLNYEGSGLDRTAINGIEMPNDWYNPVLDAAGSPTGNDTSKNLYTHAYVYRTLDIGENGLKAGNNEQAYYYITKYDINDADNYDATPTVGEYPELNITDDELLATTTGLAETLDMEEMPAGDVSASSNGYLHTAAVGSTTVNHSSYATNYLAGLYHPAFQIESLDEPITALEYISGKLLIFSILSTRTINTTSTVTNAGDEGTGTFIPVLPTSKKIANSVGIGEGAKSTLKAVDDGTIMGYFIDGTIRKTDGVSFSNNLAEGKVNSLISDNYDKATAVFSPNNEYTLWMFNSSVGESSEICLRYGMSEESGKGFSIYSGDGWPSYFSFIDNLGAVHTRVGFGSFSYYSNNNGTIVIFVRQVGAAGNKKTINRMCFLSKYGYIDESNTPFDRLLTKDIHGLQDGDVTEENDGAAEYDIPVRIDFPETTGRSESQTLYFEKANFYLRSNKEANEYTGDGLDFGGDPTKEFTYADDGIVDLNNIQFDLSAQVDESSTQVAITEDFEYNKGVSFNKQVSGERIRLRLESNLSGFQLVGYEAIFKASDRIRPSSSNQIDSITSLMQNLAYWQGINASNRALARSAGNTSTDIGTVIHSYDSTYGYKSAYTSGEDSTISVVAGTNDDFTVMTWLDANLSTDMLIVTLIDTATLYVFISSNGSLNIVADSTVTDTGYDITSDTITHIAITFIGPTTYNLYINGSIVVSGGTLGGSLPATPTASNLIIGWTSMTTTKMDVYDTRVYNKVLTSNEIAFYYNDVISNSGGLVLPK
jgi:hypothetical protein